MGFIQQLKQVKKKKAVRIAFSLFLILCSSLLQTYVIQSFINPANLLSAGFTGLAILLDRIAQLYGGMFPTSIGILVLNIPVAAGMLSARSEKRFTILQHAAVLPDFLLIERGAV